MDLEHLTADLPKYKPWVSAESWEEWEEFLAKTDDLLSTQPHLPVNKWKLSQLASAAISRPSATSVTLASDTVALLAKETTEPPKVHEVYIFLALMY